MTEEKPKVKPISVEETYAAFDELHRVVLTEIVDALDRGNPAEALKAFASLPPPIFPSWGGAPEGTVGLREGGAPTEHDFAELYRALYGWRSPGGGDPEWRFVTDPDDPEKSRADVPSTTFILLLRLFDWYCTQQPWTQEKKDWYRFFLVLEERVKGKTLDEGYAAAAARLAETTAKLTSGEVGKEVEVPPCPAAAGADMVKKSYQRIVRSLPRKHR
jgi:hypothetical protein